MVRSFRELPEREAGGIRRVRVGERFVLQGILQERFASWKRRVDARKWECRQVRRRVLQRQEMRARSLHLGLREHLLGQLLR